ncbi:MAG: hypothetical protein AAGD32_00690 [Planctomycetota bacterium]
MSQTTIPADPVNPPRRVHWLFSRILAGFAVFSVFSGSGLIFLTEGHPDAFGWQFVIWGLIDLVFAATGLRAIGPMDDAERAKLVDALSFSIKVLNPIWIISGVVLLAFGLWGHGLGVLIQGGFLTAFDPIFRSRLRAA